MAETRTCVSLPIRSSEENEHLLDVAFNVLQLLSQNVEAHGLGERSALADGNDVSGGNTECGRAVGGDGAMALLEPVVLLDVVEIVTADDDGVLHLGGDDDSPEDSRQ